MDKPSILIAMNDRGEINAYGHALAEAGFRLETAHDGADALQIALKTMPVAIIAEIELRGIPGARLLEILKANPNTSRIPLLLISGSMAEVRGFRPGFDSFALRPLNLEELSARIRKMAEPRELNKTGRANVIEGVLKHMSIPDIIQFLHINKKEGELRVSCPPQKGTIYVKKGDIFNARLESATAEKALYRLLAWNSGWFEFIPCEVHLSKGIRGSASAVLMEGMRQMDELKKIRKALPGKDAVLRTTVQPTALPKGLKPIFHDCLNIAANGVAMDAFISRLSYTDYECSAAIAALLSKGMLEVSLPRPARADNAEELITPDEAVMLRNAVAGQRSFAPSGERGRILLISNSGEASRKFLSLCSSVRGFSEESRDALYEVSHENPFGTTGAIRFYGIIDVIIFAVPAFHGAVQLCEAFSSGIIGLMLLWDEKDAPESVLELRAIKESALSNKTIPAAHCMLTDGKGGDKAAEFKKAFNIASASNGDADCFFAINQDSGLTGVLRHIIRDYIKQTTHALA